MPNIEHYLVQTGDEDWTPVSDRFSWKLRRGENHLQVKALNKFGRQGPASYLTVKYS